MGRPRNPDREKAKEIWLSAEPDTIKLKDIAEQLGYPENAIRKWKSEDNWESERSDNKNRNAPKSSKKKSKKEQRKRGPPKGNKNAVGHGAPVGNQNAVTHGGYASILFDSLDDDEQSLISQMEPNEEQLLIDEINLLTVRERRILRRIEEAKASPLGISSSVRTENKRAFDTKEDEALYHERVQEKIDKKERLPGREYSVHTTTEASYSIILKLEEALTRCQAQKQRAIDSLNKIRQAQGSKGGALADDWIAGVLGADGEDNESD